MFKSLLVFHCNYGCILYYFQDKASYWPKIYFFLPPAVPVKILPYFLRKKLE